MLCLWVAVGLNQNKGECNSGAMVKSKFVQCVPCCKMTMKFPKAQLFLIVLFTFIIKKKQHPSTNEAFIGAVNTVMSLALLCSIYQVLVLNRMKKGYDKDLFNKEHAYKLCFETKC